MLQINVSGKVQKFSNEVTVVEERKYLVAELQETCWQGGEKVVRTWYIYIPEFLHKRAEKLVKAGSYVGFTGKDVVFGKWAKWHAADTVATIYISDLWILA